MSLVQLGTIVGGAVLTSLLGNNSNDVDRVETKLDNSLRQQSEFNTNISSVVSGQGKQLDDLKTDNDRLVKLGEKIRDQLGDTNTKLGRVESDTAGLRQNLDRTDNQLNRMQSDLNVINTEVARRGTQLEERHNSFRDQQLAINDGFKQLASDTSLKLDKTSMDLVEVRSRADYLEQGQNRTYLDVSRVDGRINKIQADQYNFNLSMTDRSARMEQQHKSFSEQQVLLLSKTDSLFDKQYATECKLELMNLRAETLREGQDRIDRDLREDRKINEDRLRDQISRNQMFAVSNAEVAERQSCFMNDQKSRNDQMFNRTEHIREQLGETSRKADLANSRVDRVEQLLDQFRQEYRGEQRRILEHLNDLVGQLSTMEERSNTMQNQLEALQSKFELVNEKCIKLEVTMGMVGKVPVEPKRNLYYDGNNDGSGVYKMS